MPHKNAVKHTLTWRSKNKAYYNEYQKILVRKIREYEKFAKRLREININ
jgi:hypothetical protein